MLRELLIENLALVKRVEMPLEAGFTVFSGETGAGKSLLINALGQLAGGKSDAALVRTGAEKAVVEAVFDRPLLLPADDFPADGGELILRREIPANGRQKSLLNGAQLPAEKLPALAAYLFEIHGQHAGQRLLREEHHLDLLDRYGDLQREAQTLRLHSQEVWQLKQAAGEDDAARKKRQDQISLVEFHWHELESARLDGAELPVLEAEHALLARSGALKALAAEGYGALYENEEALLTRLAKVSKAAGELHSLDARAGDPARLLSEAAVLLKEAAYAFRDYGEKIAGEEGRLAQLDSRLAQYHDLARKHGGSLAEALAAKERLARELEVLKRADALREKAAEQLPGRVAAWQKSAAALHKKREKAAKQLESEITAELQELGLEKLVFAVDFLSLHNPGPLAAGSHAARFLIAPNPGEPLLPLNRVASGGELSRLMLALSLVLAPDQGMTLLFDEADAGIGGSVAEAVGRRLKRLAKHHQVLCVTHLPQIAAHAHQHYKVSKAEIGGRTLASVETLDAQGREDEIARMLAGDKVNPTARAHARALLRQAAE